MFFFLCLDTEEHRQQGQVGPALSDEQIEYFAAVLRKKLSVRWTLLFLHQPLWHENYKTIDTGWEKFEKILGNRQYTVLSGHQHKSLKTIRNGRNYYNLATTGGNSNLTGPEDGSFHHIVWVT